VSRRNTHPSFCPDPVSRVRHKIPADSANGPLSARTAQAAHPSGGHRGLPWRFRHEHLPKEYAYFFFYSLVRTSYVKRLAARRRGALARPQARPRAHLQPRDHALRVRAHKGRRACRTGARRRPEHEP